MTAVTVSAPPPTLAEMLILIALAGSLLASDLALVSVTQWPQHNPDAAGLGPLHLPDRGVLAFARQWETDNGVKLEAGGTLTTS